MRRKQRELLVTGYLKKESNKLNQCLPKDLYIIVCKYYSVTRDAPKNGKYHYRFKMVLLGQKKVGKTSILKRLTV